MGRRLKNVRSDDLAAHCIAELVKRTKIDPNLIEDVVLGCTNQAGEDNRNVGRMAALLAGLPYSAAGQTINRLCASGSTPSTALPRPSRWGRGMFSSPAAPSP